MYNYYYTFMQKQATKRAFVKITAENEGQSREAMFAHFGDKFMTGYSEKMFEGQQEEFGLWQLLHIKVVNHGTPEHPSLEYIAVHEED